MNLADHQDVKDIALLTPGLSQSPVPRSMLYQPAMASGGLTEAANGATTPLTAGSPTPTPSKPPKQPTTLSLNKASLRGSAQNLLEMATEAEVASAVPKACQVHENDRAEIVIVCEPEGASLLMGGLHPRASLYEQPINLEEARKQHEGFRAMMRKFGVKVLTVREILRYAAETNIRSRIELEDFAVEALDYSLAEGYTDEDFGHGMAEFLSDDYKRKVLESMAVDQLLDVIFTNPTVTIMPSGRDTGFSAAYSFEPLSNLIYTRDQQITTARGIVMGRLRSGQRQREVALMRLCFDKLGMPVIGTVRAPGFLEGGDFFPAGADLCMVGIGLRSNLEACQQLMDEHLLGTRRLAVVKDEFDRHQDRMHLDCVFSILSDDCCIMLEDIMGDASPSRRLVDEYELNSISGRYELKQKDVEFSAYVQSKGFHIIPVPGAFQLKYGCNCLNLGGSTILSVHQATARAIARSPHFKGDVFFVPFEAITNMYGAVHCGSQVIRRTPRTGPRGVFAHAGTANGLVAGHHMAPEGGAGVGGEGHGHAHVGGHGVGQHALNVVSGLTAALHLNSN